MPLEKLAGEGRTKLGCVLVSLGVQAMQARDRLRLRSRRAFTGQHVAAVFGEALRETEAVRDDWYERFLVQRPSEVPRTPKRARSNFRG